MARSGYSKKDVSVARAFVDRGYKAKQYTKAEKAYFAERGRRMKMSRSGYTDDNYGSWEYVAWRGAVTNAIRGKRGQAFMREMLAALDALPEKRLIAEDLVTPEGECCAMGAVAKSRACDVSQVDPEDSFTVANVMGIANSLAAEIAFMNDEAEPGRWVRRDGQEFLEEETPEARFIRMREWVLSQIKVSE